MSSSSGLCRFLLWSKLHQEEASSLLMVLQYRFRCVALPRRWSLPKPILVDSIASPSLLKRSAVALGIYSSYTLSDETIKPLHRTRSVAILRLAQKECPTPSFIYNNGIRLCSIRHPHNLTMGEHLFFSAYASKDLWVFIEISGNWFSCCSVTSE